MLDTGRWSWMPVIGYWNWLPGCWGYWMPKMLDAGDTGCRRYWMPEILDAGDIGYWRYWIPEKWMLRMPGVGAGDACCFIIVC